MVLAADRGTPSPPSPVPPVVTARLDPGSLPSPAKPMKQKGRHEDEQSRVSTDCAGRLTVPVAVSVAVLAEAAPAWGSRAQIQDDAHRLNATVAQNDAATLL